MMCELDSPTGVLIDQLYNAWNNEAETIVYADLRDELLAQHDHVHTRIATLSAVVNVAYPDIAKTQRYFDSKWDHFFTIANSVDLQDEEENAVLGKRKRTYNEAIRARNLAVVASLWSLRVVTYYGWDSAAQGQMKLLRACATKYPRFTKDFCPRLNSILLNRHREAIRFGRRKSLIEAPLQPHCDLDIAALDSVSANAKAEELWITSRDGSVPVDSDGTLLKDVRPHHFLQYLLQRDSYGMLAVRQGRAASPIDLATEVHPLVIATPSSEVTTPGGPYTPDWAHELDHNNFDEITSNIQEMTMSPLALFNRRPPEFSIDGLGVESVAPSPMLGQSHLDLHRICSVTPPSTGEVEVPDATCDVEHMCNSDGLTSRDQSSDMGSNSDTQHSNQAGVRPQISRTRKKSKKQQRDPPNQEKQCSAVGGARLRSTRRTKGVVRPVDMAASTQPTSTIGLAIGTPLLEGVVAVGLEESLHRKHYAATTSFLEKLSNEALATSDGPLRQMKAEWFTSNTKWVRVWTTEDSGLPAGSATSQDDAEVLYYTSDDFIMDAQSGKVFRKPVVIKESFSDGGMHSVHAFASVIDDALGAARLDIRGLKSKLRASSTMDARDFANLLRSNAENGLHAINMRNITKAHKPLFTMLTRFRLLDNLIERLHGNLSEHESSSTNVAGDVTFNTAFLSGAFAGPYVNDMGGIWMRNLDGPIYLMVVPDNKMETEWENFAKDGEAWLPNGKQRLVVLDQDDVLFMPPGLRVVHAFLTPKRAVVEGGTVWDELDMLWTLKSIRRMCRPRRTMSDLIEPRLPYILSSLEEMVMKQPNRFRGHATLEVFQTAFHHTLEAVREL